MTKNNNTEIENLLQPQRAKFTFLQEHEDEEISAEIDFDALIDLTKKDLSQEKKDDFGAGKDDILFYCKDCKKETDVTRLPDQKKQKIQFKCNICQGRNIVYGTARGVKEYYERKKDKK